MKSSVYAQSFVAIHANACITSVCVCVHMHLYMHSEDLWVREGKILDPEKLFFDEKGYADKRVDCEGSIIAPGFIDVQINGTNTHTLTK